MKTASTWSNQPDWAWLAMLVLLVVFWLCIGGVSGAD